MPVENASLILLTIPQTQTMQFSVLFQSTFTDKLNSLLILPEADVNVLDSKQKNHEPTKPPKQKEKNPSDSVCGLNAAIPMPVLLIGPCLSPSLALGLSGTAEKEQPLTGHCKSCYMMSLCGKKNSVHTL